MVDKFYTLPHISKHCISLVSERYNWNTWDLILEPSAGNGSFLFQIPSDKKIGIDIFPDHSKIEKKDFFLYFPPPDKKNILVIGNPPFGRVSSLAIKFFNHASQWASVIAFIVPRTFRRISVQNKLSLDFFLEYDENIPLSPCSFEPPMMAKCCFQIWKKNITGVKRELIKLSMTHKDWAFLPLGVKDKKGQPTPPKDASFAIRAYGGKCGEIISDNLESLRPKSWHWIKCNDKINKDELIKRFSSLDYSLSLDTARQNSIGKAELVNLYSEFYDS